MTSLGIPSGSGYTPLWTAKYDETDEETFRPWDGPLPVDASEGTLLVRATATLADGTELPAFLTPGFEGDDLGTLQPQVFVAGGRYSFWGGVIGFRPEERARFYEQLGSSSESVFPIIFATEPQLASGSTAAHVEGFYSGWGDDVRVER